MKFCSFTSLLILALSFSPAGYAEGIADPDDGMWQAAEDARDLSLASAIGFSVAAGLAACAKYALTHHSPGPAGALIGVPIGIGFAAGLLSQVFGYPCATETVANFGRDADLEQSELKQVDSALFTTGYVLTIVSPIAVFLTSMADCQITDCDKSHPHRTRFSIAYGAETAGLVLGDLLEWAAITFRK